LTENNQNLIIFTGQSGIKAEECLNRLNQPKIKDLKTFYLEKQIVKDYHGNIKQFLTEDILFQSDQWHESFNNTYNEIKNISPSNKIFLSFHASYYHQDTCELFSVLNFKSLLKLKDRVKCIIVFIDDIYDIYKRLLAQGEMFDDIMYYNDAYKTIYKSILNLISILEWRQLEINVTRLLANMFGVEFYIVAIKHPVFLIRRLIDNKHEDLGIFYLAHPISTIRRSSVSIIPNFAAEINNFAKKIIEKFDNFVLFLPGTIDELKIKYIQKDNHEVFIPKFFPRLDAPYPEDKQIGPPLIKRLEEIDIFDPPKCNISTINPDDEKRISSLLHQLSDLIRLQVTSRDLNLINQSKNGVIAYRPYFPDKLSGGVRAEMKYNSKLCKRDKRRNNVIISVNEDQAKARILRFFLFILTSIKGITNQLEIKIKDERDTWLRDIDMKKNFSDDMYLKNNFNQIREKLEKILPKDYVFKDFKYERSETFTKGLFAAQLENRENNYQKIRDGLIDDEISKLVKSENYKRFEDPDLIKIEEIF